MPTLSQRLGEFISSPRGKRLVEQGQHQLAKPENRKQVKRLLDKLRASRTRGG
jgi:hypothetical protein